MHALRITMTQEEAREFREVLDDCLAAGWKAAVPEDHENLGRLGRLFGMLDDALNGRATKSRRERGPR